MRATAEEPPDRLAERLAVDVPERDVDGGIAAHLGAGIARSDIDAAEPPVVQLDIARVLAEKVGRDVAVEIGGDRRRREEGLAGADDPGIGVDAEPEEKRELGEFQGLDRRDLHAASPFNRSMRLDPASEEERRHAAVDDEAGAGDERGVVGEEEADRRRDLLGIGDAGDRVRLEGEAERLGAAGRLEAVRVMRVSTEPTISAFTRMKSTA